MRLAELAPRWIHTNVFVFLCPHCRKTLLSCKNVVMSRHMQFGIFARKLTDDFERANVVPTKPESAWIFEGDLPGITVKPSIDASALGHWHGHITAGEIVGGQQAPL
jgi:hypothetical protein